MQDLSEDIPPDEAFGLLRKRAVLREGILAGSESPFRDSSISPPPRWSKARPSGPISDSHESLGGPQSRDMLDTYDRPRIGKRELWSPGQDAPLTKASFNAPSNIASVQPQKSRAQALQPKSRKPFQLPPQIISSPTRIKPNYLPSSPSSISSSQDPSLLANYDIMLQPGTRPISQEQLVAEVKGMYAGLVMVEAKCIEVDNKQATPAQADPGTQPKLNNEQWQALIVLHRTLLHEHHDFFLASQHPSASPALRTLASKYAMLARMWRHDIHSLLELLRHRFPTSLEHMLAFIYLAYSMMALLYETVPAFKDTWIQCLGDLGRYRMAIEDDDIRDREVWTGVAKHWYSKASDKTRTTGRLYHHLAILARTNALQQLFYYAKCLCVVITFTSARESVLTLFETVLNAENDKGQYRLPPLDTSLVKAHGLLLTKTHSQSPGTSKNQRILLGYLKAEELLQKHDDSGGQCSTDQWLRSNSQSLKHQLRSEAENGLPEPHSRKWRPISCLSQCYGGFLGASAFYGQIGVVTASPASLTADKFRHILDPTDPAVTLGVTLGTGVVCLRLVKRYLDLDMTFLFNFGIQTGLLLVASDHRFSKGELFVLCFCGNSVTYLWAKDKLVKLSKTGGLTALAIFLSGVYGAWKLVQHFPILERRFENQLIPKLILTSPTMAISASVWGAVIEQTGLANAAENLAEALGSGVYNAHIWEFINGVLRVFMISFFERAVTKFMEWLFGPRAAAGLEGNAFREPAQDVEAHLRELLPIPENEPFRIPDSENFYRQERENGFTGQWPNPAGNY